MVGRNRWAEGTTSDEVTYELKLKGNQPARYVRIRRNCITGRGYTTCNDPEVKKKPDPFKRKGQ